MKHLLLLAIKIYWHTIPAGKRTACLFSVSCSQHVFAVTKKQGFIKGLQALCFRFKNCRHGAAIFINPITGKTQMLLPCKDVICEEDIAKHLLQKSRPA